MESLPDDVLHQILLIGAEAGRLDHTDLCSLAIVNSRFDQLTQYDFLWNTLLFRDYPSSFLDLPIPSKYIYRMLKHEKEVSEHWREFLPMLSVLEFSYFPLPQVIRFHSQHLSTLVDPIIDNGQANLPFHEEGAPAQSYTSHPSLRQAHNNCYEKRPSKRIDKSSRQKVIPMSKSYIPMNRPPRRSMPRKI